MVEKEKNLNLKEEYLGILDRIIIFINNCDNKASIILGIYGVFGGILLTSNLFYNFIKNLFLLKFDNYLLIYIFLLLIASLLFIWGIIRLFLVLYAKIDTKVYAEKGLVTNSKIFYGTISNYSFQEYKLKISNLTEEEFKDDILSQIYIDSKICIKKFQNYNKGLKCSFLGLISFLILIIFGVVIF